MRAGPPEIQSEARAASAALSLRSAGKRYEIEHELDHFECESAPRLYGNAAARPRAAVVRRTAGPRGHRLRRQLRRHDQWLRQPDAAVTIADRRRLHRRELPGVQPAWGQHQLVERGEN